VPAGDLYRLSAAVPLAINVVGMLAVKEQHRGLVAEADAQH